MKKNINLKMGLRLLPVNELDAFKISDIIHLYYMTYDDYIAVLHYPTTGYLFIDTIDGDYISYYSTNDYKEAYEAFKESVALRFKK